MDIEKNFNKNLKKAAKKQMPKLPAGSKFIFQQLLKNAEQIEENLQNENMVEINVGSLNKVIRTVKENLTGCGKKEGKCCDGGDGRKCGTWTTMKWGDCKCSYAGPCCSKSGMVNPGFSFSHDMNMDYSYNAEFPDDREKDEKEELQEKWWVSKYSKCNCECTIYFDEADGSTTKTTYKCCCNSSNAPCKKKRECPKRKGYDFLTSGTAEEIPDESIISVEKVNTSELDDMEIEGEMGEATTSSSAGAYVTPRFWAKKKRKNKKRSKSRSNHKRLMPGAKFVRVKNKCKKFPYCNQGDINALEIWEKSIMRESAKNVAKKTGKSESEVREMIEKELSEIIRRSFYKSPIKDLVGGGKMKTPIGKIFNLNSPNVGPKYES